MQNDIQAVHVQVFGRVQLVMFRDFVQRKARGLRLKGWVKNREDGSVELIAQGDRPSLEQLVAHVHKGSLLSRVDRVEVDWQEPRGPFDGFAIVY